VGEFAFRAVGAHVEELFRDGVVEHKVAVEESA
jgi:hypothetical protein